MRFRAQLGAECTRKISAAHASIPSQESMLCRLGCCASTSSVDAVNAKADQALANSQQALQAAQQAQATAQQANQQTSMLYQRSLKK